MTAHLARPSWASPVQADAGPGAWWEPWLYDGPGRVVAALDVAAPGPAAEPAPAWLGTVGSRDGSADNPALWRIGTGAIPTPFGAVPEQGIPIAVPLLDVGHLQISATPERRETAEALVEALLLRVVHTYRPGLVHIHVWDLAQVAGTLPGLYPLTRSGILTVHSAPEITALVAEQSTRVAQIRTHTLAGGHESLAQLGGERTEPWTVIVLLGTGDALPERDRLALQRLARAGLACGTSLITVDLPVPLPGPTETITLSPDAGDDPDTARCSISGAHVVVYLDEPVPTAAAAGACAALSDWHLDWMLREARFADLLPAPGQWWTSSSADGLRAPVGWSDIAAVEMALDDQSPHALIVGPSGSGKTNLLLAWIAGLTTRYSPRELKLFMLDYKEGVSIAQFTPQPGREDFLPHAALVGININGDREFGLALLQHLHGELVARAAAIKAAKVSKFADLRRADPDGDWPRIVAIIDEFQYLFTPHDGVAKAAALLLDDIARRGRSQGIHLVLASQDTSGIVAFWGQPGVLQQFVLRVGLPQARHVMADVNDVAMGLPRFHAAINHDSGVGHGNKTARIPNATVPGTMDAVQRALHAHWKGEGPVVLDGDIAPPLESLRAAPSAAVVGQSLAVTGRAAAVGMPGVAGRNLAVFGDRDAQTVLGAAAVSLVGNLDAATARVVNLAPDAHRVADWTAARCGVEATHGGAGLAAVLDEALAQIEMRTAADELDPPRLLLVVFGLDAVDGMLDYEGVERLRTVLHRGPQVGVQLLGWWRSVARLRSLVTLPPTSLDDIGAWVACEAHGGDLSALLAGELVDWSPRPGRGLLCDRAGSGLHVIMVPDLGLDEEAL